MALQYQRTFINFEESCGPVHMKTCWHTTKNKFQNVERWYLKNAQKDAERRRGVKGWLSKANDACSEKYVDGLLHKTGENYEWPIDAQGNTSKGSLGHPEVCGRFCIRFFYGNCRQGENCEFGHLAHREPKVKMDKAQRQLFEMLGEAEVLSLVLPHIERRCGRNGLNRRMLFVIHMLRRRLTSLPHPDDNHVLHARAVIPILRKFTVARLLELIRQSPAFPSGFKEDLKKLADRSLGRQ
ncbi:unnamed protein product [Cladocopium goreaui]|uniref:C3H1-type domain-containing protein n=1 Tax=Cladocopium goreaui TaxID=2562237 RepID=A0A9P1BI20_9DINO|nr:unnamed protein product [Cladocopium goreaui]